MKAIKAPLSLSIASVISLAAIAPTSLAAEGFWQEGNISTKFRGIHFDREYENESKDRTQSALGIELNYTSPMFGDVLGFDISGYHVQEMSTSGFAANDILTKDNNGEMDEAFSKIGQAYLKLNLDDKVSAKLGRQRVYTMLLSSSGTRAIPSSYRGVTVNGKIDKFEVYGAWVDEWSARHDDTFNGFKTDVSDEGDIDHISVLGVKYKAGNLSLELEQLNSKDYLKKLGLRAKYNIKLENSSLTLSGGAFTSQDDGDLFVVNAEKGDVDYVAGITPENNAKAYFIDANWKRDKLTLGAAFTTVRGDVWIEDNFAGDHGRNPFPTRAVIAPDLTGKNEKVWQARVAYDWNASIPGLTTKLTYTYGSDAENTVDKALGTADEWYTELDVTWKVPVVKGLSLRWIAHDYHSDETGSVKVVKGDELDNRIYLDYVHKF